MQILLFALTRPHKSKSTTTPTSATATSTTTNTTPQEYPTVEVVLHQQQHQQRVEFAWKSLKLNTVKRKKTVVHGVVAVVVHVVVAVVRMMHCLRCT